LLFITWNIYLGYKLEMVSELLCTMHKNANDLACGRLGMGRKAKAMSNYVIIVVRVVRVVRVI